MRVQIFFVLLVISLLGLGGCKNGTESKVTEEAKITYKYSSLPQSRIDEMLQKVDYVDYLFYEQNFSMSLDNPEAIKMAVSSVGSSQIKLGSNCKAIGRIFFEYQGKTMESADIFFNKNCAYFIFQKDGKPAFANTMTVTGKQLLNTQLGAIIPNFERIE